MSQALSASIRLSRGAFTLDAAFEIPLDGITALFGPSGAGKSLLLSALAGLRKIETGRIALGARVLDDVAARVRTPAHLRGVGMVFQDARLFPHLTVRGNLDYALRRAPEPRARLAAAAADFDIATLLDRPVRNLSGGEKSRVALARAFLSAPDLLLLDEPFAALDGARRRAFLSLLRDIHARSGLPLLVVTHEIEDAAALADHVLGMKGGRIVAAGPFAATAAHPAFQALLDARDIGAAIPRAAFQGAGKTGASVWVRADNVVLASARPHGLSARNIWAARITALSGVEDGVLVALEASFGPLFARVTESAAADLALAPGQDVWAIVKAHAH